MSLPENRRAHSTFAHVCIVLVAASGLVACSSGGGYGVADGGVTQQGNTEAGPESRSSATDAGTGAGCVGKTFFVTSTTYKGNLGGVAGGDAKCQAAADAEGLQGTFKAWLSSADTAAGDRIVANGPWCNVRGQLVFKNKANLATTPQPADRADQMFPLNSDERGAAFTPTQSFVWTGTEAGGQTGSANCIDWTDQSSSYSGGGGHSYAETGVPTNAWTAGPDTHRCSDSGHLYCLAQ